MPNRRAARYRGLLASLTLLCALLLLCSPGRAAAATCPNSNPVVNENNCMGEGTNANQEEIESYSDDIGAFTPQTNYALGENVPLKIGTDLPSFPGTSVNVAVYRIGYYGGKGARLIAGAGATNVKVNNTYQCNPANTTTGETSCSNWNVSYTIPGNKLPISGIYEAVFTDVADGGISNYVVFPVRDESRASSILYVLPTADYEAYNTWGCKSLYFDACGGANTIAGDGRAVAVSFDRPQEEGDKQLNHFFGPDYNTVFWLEEQGYDVTYTDDVQTDSNAQALLNHKVDLVSGHSEYWSYNSFNNFKKARDAGVNIVSLSANTAYWQTRYENNHRTLVCYKTIQGSATGNPGGTPNDPASEGPNGEALPHNATTTRRDPGAPAGDPNAPPGGRIGPNEPENSLWGNMYVGDNDENNFHLTIPAGNANGEFASNRFWRNTGLSTGQSTTLPEGFVGWEWDQIPTQPGYLAQEPAGVKQLSLTDVTNPEDSWLQDSGRARASTAPPGEPSNVSAVEYRAPSGALVFSSGTMEWSLAFDEDPVIDQGTYNVISEMGVQPGTPAEDIKLDSPTAAKAPWPSFTESTTATLIGQPVSFNGSLSSSPDAKVTDYKWDFENTGSFATDTATTPTTTHTFTQPGTFKVVLKVTDSLGQQETTSRTIIVSNTATAKLNAAMNPVGVGQSDQLSAVESSDIGGTIADYKWDLNGDGTYETDTGTTPTVNKTFTTPGVATVGVRITDSKGATATATLSVRVLEHGVSRYSDAVKGAPGLLHYYRLDEQTGSSIADSAGESPGTLTGANLGVPGAVNGDPDTAANFPGDGDPFEGQPGSFGAIPTNLSGQTAITVEFWLKWDAYGNNDSLAMELTPNYNETAGGFIVDPDAIEYGGTFGVGIGIGSTRNSVFFARPSAGVWHHYAFVLNSGAPAATEVTPYVDGQPVSYQKESSGTGAGAFAASTLYLMSRGGASLFGSGSLDELAIYSGELGAGTIEEQAQSNGQEPRPVASVATTPSLPHAGQAVTLSGASSHYSGGSIVKYEWDLNIDGSYETKTGSTPTTSTSFANPGSYTVGLRVTDSDGGTATTTKQISVGTFPPSASVSVSPSPALTGQTVKLDASGSTDQGTITDYKWDFDNSGSFATDTGSNPVASTSFQTAGIHTVGVRLTDSQGLSTTTTTQVTVLSQGVSDYEDTVLGTPGLIDYYKLGEPSGPTIADSAGTSNGAIAGGSFGLPGAVKEDPTTAIGFNGSSDSGAIPLNLSGTSKLTLEFWLKWNAYANNDALAMEFTPNFNENAGGLLVDPNAGQFGGTFGIGIGNDSDRNSVFFQRPSAGVWHHYAIVVDTTAAAGNEITPYVDGSPVGFQQSNNSTGQGAFANSTLYLMSRAGSALFGNGSLDQLAVYNQPLSAATIFQHFNSSGTTKPPKAAFTSSPSQPRPGQTVTLNASGSSDANGPITDYQWDLNGDGSYETDTGSNPVLTTSFPNSGTQEVGLRVIDGHGASASVSHSLTVGNLPPSASLTATPNPTMTGETVKLDASGSTDQGAITDYQWDLDGDGTYETDTATTPTVTTSFATAGAHTVGVKLTDDHGLSTTKTATITVLEQAPAKYSEAVQATPGLTDYYHLDEPAGPAIHDSKGTATGTIAGGTFGVPGAIAPNTGLAFNGTSDSGAIPLNLSGTSKLTVEFWLKWNQYANNDALAMEFTPNFNETEGGFLVDPNAGEFGGTFGVAIGADASRNSVFFQRPSAGVWHHYAIVIDTTAAAGNEITPYVDGSPVGFQQESAGSGQGAFANSTLYLMSRAGSSLFGNGALDELAIYNQPLAATAVFAHFHSTDVNTSLTPSFKVTPANPVQGQSSTLDASASTDTNGTITDYKWDVDGSGNYAIDTGSTPTLSGAAPAAGTYTVGLQVTDSNGVSARTTHKFTVTSAPPTTPVLTLSGATGSTFLAGTTAYTNPQAGNSGAFTLSASTSDSFSGIKDVVFPALSGFSAGGVTDTVSPYQTTYSWSGANANATGAQAVTANNNAGLSASANFNVVPDTTAPGSGALTINGMAATASGSASYSIKSAYTLARTDYSETQSASASGLRSSTLTVAAATLSGNVCGTFGAASTVSGAPAQSEPTGCYRYTLTGIDNVGNKASVSSTVMVDTSTPTTPQLSFSGLSANTFYKTSTNALYFRPAAGGAFTLTAASTDADTGIREYVFSSLAANGFTEKLTGGTMAYVFGATATQPAGAPTLYTASNAGAISANATYALIADATGPTGGALTVNGTPGTAAGATSFNNSGTVTIGTRTDFNADTGSGFLSSALTRATATLSNGVCGTFGAETTLSGNPTQTNQAAGCYRYSLTGIDRVGNASVLTTTVEIDRTAPTASASVPATATEAPVAVTFSATDTGAGINAASGVLRRASATYTASNNSCSTFSSFANIGTTGLASPFSDTTVASGKCYEYQYTVADRAGNSTTSAAATVRVQSPDPTLTAIADTTPGSTAGRPQVNDAMTLTFSAPIAASSIPSSVTITYTRASTFASSTISITGISSGNWATGDSFVSPYTDTGTSPTLNATATVSGSTVKLTVTKVNDPSAHLNTGGPGAISGALASTIKDTAGHPASSATFTSSSIRLF